MIETGDKVMRVRPIVVTDLDARRLRALLARQGEASNLDQGHLQQLQSELERARVLLWEEMPADVVTMHSEVRVLDLESGGRSDYTLVFPREADVSAKRISVLAPLGTALLGFRKGDTVEWMMPGGIRRLRIERVHQPVAYESEAPAPALAAPLGAH
jgi:regulator of nucleoside diphosphate kinase